MEGLVLRGQITYRNAKFFVLFNITSEIPGVEVQVFRVELRAKKCIASLRIRLLSVNTIDSIVTFDETAREHNSSTKLLIPTSSNWIESRVIITKVVHK